MTSGPPPRRQRATHATTEGRIYLELRRQAKVRRLQTGELLTLYVLERFLHRAFRSPHGDRLVLKGGMLLAAIGDRRPTRDIDMVARGIDSGEDSARRLVTAIIGVVTEDDGVTFDVEGLQASAIREQDDYAGVRVTVPARIATAKESLKIDLSFGDPIVPEPQRVRFPTLLSGSEEFEVTGYPPEAVLGEKIETMVRRGDTNTRWRDFADVVMLTRQHHVEADTLRRALEATASMQGTRLRPLGDVLHTFPGSRQRFWAAWRSMNRMDVMPALFADVVDEVRTFADPVLDTPPLRVRH